MARVAAAQLSHETNVFSAVVTDLAAFQRSGIERGVAILERERGTNSAFGGFAEGADLHGWELIPILSVWATPSGMVTAAAVTALLDELTNGLRAAMASGPLDGVLLGLHGAMVTELDRDGDGMILERVRDAVGSAVPVVATLDLHANISERMVRAASILVGYDTYPHVDMAARAREAADLLARLISAGARPVTALIKPPMLPTSQNMPTNREPMRSLIASAHEMERDPRVLNVTVAGGFPPADVAEGGMSVLVTTDGDLDLARELADRLAREAWHRRDGFLGGVTSFDEAARLLQNLPARPERPLVLVDIGDNPWSGSPGDSAELPRFLVEQRVAGAAVAMVVDPGAVARCAEAGVGNRVELLIGGKTDALHGPPLAVSATVRALGDGNYVNEGPMMAGLPVDLGPTAVIATGDPPLEILLTSKAETPIDRRVFLAHGIEPERRRVIGLKGKGHFRAAFEPIASRVVLVEGPGISGADLSRLPFRHIRRPIWPLDEGARFD